MLKRRRVRLFAATGSRGRSSMAAPDRRRLLVVTALAVFVAAAFWAVTWARVASGALDRCVGTMPPGTTAFGAEQAWVPWRWSCTYELGDGRLVRVDRSLFDSA
jgi:hypothetical protein